MRTKKLSASSVALIVLSVLLVISVTTGATLAWFASQDNAAATFILGEPVIVSVTEADGSDSTVLDMAIDSTNLLPGMLIVPDVAVTLDASTTATIMRARIDSVVTGGAGDNAVLNTAFRDELTPVISQSWVYYDTDGWYYFLGDAGLNSRVMNTTAEASALGAPDFGATTAEYDPVLTGPRSLEVVETDTVLASVVPGGTAQTIDFLTTSFRLPTDITNEYANADISLTFYVEALQDYLVITDTNVLPTLDNAKTIMDSISTYVPI